MIDPERRPRLSLSGITRTFPGVIANQDVSLGVRAGEVDAILGENGAGKSTLMKVLYGFYQPERGQITLDGVPVTIHSPADARRLGIGMVFQQFMLTPALTVLETSRWPCRSCHLSCHASNWRSKSNSSRHATASHWIRSHRCATCLLANSRKSRF